MQSAAITSFLAILLIHKAYTFDIVQAKALLVDINRKWLILEKFAVSEKWNFMTDLTEKAQIRYINALTTVHQKKQQLYKDLFAFNWENISDVSLTRQLELFTVDALITKLPDSEYAELQEIICNLTRAYHTAKFNYSNNVFRRNSINPTLNKTQEIGLLTLPEITDEFSNCRNSSVLKQIWIETRRVWQPLKGFYLSYIDLMNAAAKYNKLRDTTDIWLQELRIHNIQSQLKLLWNQVKPLYLELHAYIRRKLILYYEKGISSPRAIPAHLIGHLWENNWSSIMDLTAPYPNKEMLTINGVLEQQGFTPESMYKTAEDFMFSLNFSYAPKNFWRKSIFSRQKREGELNCFDNLYNLYEDDVRVISCGSVNQNSYFKAHYFLALIRTYIEPKMQPFIFQEEAIPGFGRAVASALLTHVRSIKYLRKFGLLGTNRISKEDMINNLFYIAISDLPEIPYSIAVGQWEWGIFSGKIAKENYNKEWWGLLNEYQGLEPPVDRYDTDFDPISSKYIASSGKCFQNGLGTIMQFQLFKALCIEARQYKPPKPLCQCDMYGSFNVGTILKEAFRLGRSRAFEDVLDIITGTHTIKADALLEYFDPLLKWLIEDNQNHNVTVGWKPPVRTSHSVRFSFVGQ